MIYLITFLEGIIAFISPCLLPMLPVYVSYFFAGGDTEGDKKKALVNVFGFVVGFTALFVVLGAFAGTVGGLFKGYGTVVNIICGIIVILLGISFTGLINIPFLNLSAALGSKKIALSGFFSSVLFGVVFAISWTPCVGAFLGSAIMLAAQSGESMQGILLLLCFSLGLAIPFFICALLIDRFKSAFNFIKKNYKAVNIISGALLVIMGILIATGWINYLYAML